MTDKRRKLTEDDEKAILARRAEDPDISTAALGKEFGVHKATVARVIERHKPQVPAGVNGLADIPHNRIAPSPLNPRKTFDEEAIRDLAIAMRAEAAASGGSGVLQNLVVRTKPDGDYEIVAGERRWRAVQDNIEAGELDAGVTVTCRIRECTDAQLLELALVENIDREDMPALEEAEALARLFDLQKADAADLTQRQFAIAMAGQLGKSPRYVEIRLGLVTKLCDEAKEWLANGNVNMAMARALMQHGEDEQKEGLRAIEYGWDIDDAADLARHLADPYPETTAAIFERDLYDGEIIEDPDDPDGGWFKDVDQFLTLQRAAAEALAEQYKEDGATFAFVIDQLAGDAIDDDAYNRYGGGKGVIVCIGPGGRVHTWKEVSKRRQDKSKSATGTDAGNDAPAKPKDPGTFGHRQHARRRKSMALQDAVARDGRTAMILTCLALMRGQCENVRIGTTAITGDDYKGISENLRGRLKGLADGAGIETDDIELLGREPLGNIGIGRGRGEELDFEIYHTLRELSDEYLQKLFAALVARQVGTFNNFTSNYGDTLLAIQLAQDLGIDGNEAEHGLTFEAEDLTGLSKPALETICTEIGSEPEKTMKKTAEAIVDNVPERYVVPSLHFGKPADIKERMMTPGLTAETETANTEAA